MDKITNILLGITTLFILGIMTVSAFADIDISSMSCKDIHVLVERPNGKAACVYENTAEKLGWKIVIDQFAADETLEQDLPTDFPIKPSAHSTSGSSAPALVPPPEIGMSNLPNIGQTAFVQIKYSHDEQTDIADDYDYPEFASTGWRVSSKFEIVNAYGIPYETVYVPGTNEIKHYIYNVFTPLASGDSVTYNIEIRAIKEGLAVITGFGYYQSGSSILLFVDENDTMRYEDYLELHPELHTPPVTRYVDPDYDPPPIVSTEEERVRAQDNGSVPPTWEEEKLWLAEFISEDTIDEAADILINQFGYFYNASQMREILSLANFTEQQINNAIPQSDEVSDQSASNP